jgi:predicted O-methyltransferase YrrM
VKFTSTIDRLAALAVLLGGPIFRRVGASPLGYPRYLRQADRSGVHFRTTHYYQPIYADNDLPADVTGERILPGIDFNVGGQLALLDTFHYQNELVQFAESHAPGLEFSHANPNYSFGDAESLYSMLRTRKPRRLIEIGSGYSTRMAQAAIAANQCEAPGYECEHFCIEPYEMSWLERLEVRLIRQRVQDVDLALFEELSGGDVVFIDSSHVIRPYGDVLWEYQRIIPSLPAGVMVHVHDIFTPRDYPEPWLRQQRRLWNEQYLLEAMLSHSARYRIVLALNYLKHAHFAELATALPSVGRHPDHEPGALWFEVR